MPAPGDDATTQVAHPIAPAADIVAGEVPVRPAEPTLPMGMAVGICATGRVPEVKFDALVDRASVPALSYK